MAWTSDFHMQAQVFTEKVSCQGLFLEGEMSRVLYFELLERRHVVERYC